MATPKAGAEELCTGRSTEETFAEFTSNLFYDTQSQNLGWQKENWR